MTSPLIADFAETFRSQKRLAEKAIVQLTDDELRAVLGDDLNSVAVIIKHLSGNMRSRFTAFLTTDGEKPDRNRDDEFADTFASRDDITSAWEAGWACLLGTVDSLVYSDLARTVTIRGEPHTVALALLRQVSHYGYHVGQIVLIARMLAQPRWQVITIPRGSSQQFNDRMAEQYGSQPSDHEVKRREGF